MKIKCDNYDEVGYLKVYTDDLNESTNMTVNQYADDSAVYIVDDWFDSLIRNINYELDKKR